MFQTPINQCILKVDPDSLKTPLMIGAETKSLEAINWLLEKKANPNYADAKKYTALSYAILSEELAVVKKLFKITTNHLDVSLNLLSKSLLKIDNSLRKILKRLIFKNENLYFPFLKACAEFGKFDCY